MSTNHSIPFCARRQKGSALVITLALLVLICALVLSFFVQSTLSRQIAFSSAGQYRADLAAQTALDTIIGDLRTEISAGSTAYTSNGISIYIPTNNFTAAPYRVNDQGFANLVKQSTSASPSWSGTNYASAVSKPIRSAPDNSTTMPAANGRHITINQWNKPGLLGDPGTGSLPTVPNGYTAPDWVILTRQGAATNAINLPPIGPGSGTLSDKNANNQNYVIGRYAYTIYDEGGLLDVNVAGYPSSVSGTDFPSKRGLLPQVDLANIPGIDNTANADAFIQWRNQSSAASASSYTNYVLGGKNGFTTVAPGDQTLVGRVDLINYARSHPTQLSTAALQYLATFTRELNAPSYTPPVLGGSSRPPTSTGASATQGKDDAFNPSLINLRVTKPFTRTSDGLPARVGESLIKYRFPLSRLAWISHNGPNNATESQIYESFGLTWSNSIIDSWSGATTSGWVYNHGSINGRGDGQTILLLSDVAALGREPDFFELLQAGMLLGSLGKGAADDTATVGPYDTNIYYQVLQIGANLVDQFDSDSYPTHVSFNSADFYGVENLPYLSWVYTTPYRFHGSSQSSTYPAFPNIGIWLQPVVWNPHAANTSSSSPTQFRVIATGGVYDSFYGGGVTIFTPLYDLSNSSGITFSSGPGQTFQVPTLLSPAMGATAAGNDYVTDDGMTSFVGFSTISGGTWAAPDYRIDQDPNPANANQVFVWAAAQPYPYVNFQLQYREGPASPWITYDVMRYLNGTADTYDNFPPNCFRTYGPSIGAGPGAAHVRSDPRTDRFGVHASGGPASILPATNPPNNYFTTIRPDTGIGSEAHGAHGSIASPGWFFGSGANGYFGCISDNRDSSNTHYADPDTIVRPGDGAYADGSLNNGGYPLAIDNFNSLNSRPIILNRTFRSAAEMGYASRGMPWKELDFFTAESGDAALLDLFCIVEPATPNSNSAVYPTVEAGKLNLNTRQKAVISAAIMGAIKSEAEGTVIDASTANSIADSLNNLTKTSAGGPLLNRAELATRLSPLLTGIYPTPADNIIKRRREGAIRALSDIGNTRTWNLLIDVIAQSGRYTPNATSLNQFTVEGMRRYWLHIAIDRYTGAIVQQYIEPVL